MILRIFLGIIGLSLLGWCLYPLLYIARVEARFPALGRSIPLPLGRAQVWEAGQPDGAPVLFIHGASSNLREWSQSLGAQLDPDIHVIAFDRPGHGYSSRPANAASLAVQAQFAAQVLEALNKKGPATIVAHSLGSAVALRLALDRPDLVKNIILLAPATNPYPGPNAWYVRAATNPIYGRAFTWFFVPILGPPTGEKGVIGVFAPQKPPTDYLQQAGLGLLFRPDNFRANAGDVAATKKGFAEQAPLYARIQAPVLVVSSDSDHVVSPKLHAEVLARTLPHVRLETVAHCGHLPHRLAVNEVKNAIRVLAHNGSLAEAWPAPTGANPPQPISAVEIAPASAH